MKTHFTTILTSFLLYLCCNNCIGAVEGDIDDLLFEDEGYISIATGSQQQINQAPAVASIITDKDIENLGAEDIDDVLETVPGLHVSHTRDSYKPNYISRGVYSTYNQQVLMLLNGVPLTQLFRGNRGPIWGGFPTHNIKRIEIIRGPGSALYGADAFSAVINIITKDYYSTKNILSIRVGSYETIEASISGKFKSDSNIHSAFSLDLLKTDGQNSIISSDLQTFFDSRFGTNASLAPGRLNLEKEYIDGHMDIRANNWNLSTVYQGRFNLGTGAGHAPVLDPEGWKSSTRFISSYSYDLFPYIANWETSLKLSTLLASNKQLVVLFPPGSNQATAYIYPDGVLGNPSYKERHYRGEISTFHTGIEQHRLRFGMGFNNGEIRDIKEKKNFDANNIPLPGGFVDVSDNKDLIFFKPHKRKLLYTYIQDEWNIAPDWDLTTGVRYDSFNDFGHTLNPRLALVWQTSLEFTSKFLYGRAFRAPSFSELFVMNNPVIIGNTNLDPEIIDTWEVAFTYETTSNLKISANFFNYKMKDILRSVPVELNSSQKTTENVGIQDGNGFELEFEWRLSPSVDVTGNYAYQKAKDELNDEDIANIPDQQAYMRSDWIINDNWSLYGQFTWISDRKRTIGDFRDKLDGYNITDINFKYHVSDLPWKFNLKAHNIFDNDIREPSQVPLLIDDLPMPGRTFSLQFVMEF